MKKRRFTKEDWIRHGLDELADRGPEAVKLEAICASAGLTRGSFYHHFPDHKGFLSSLAAYWFNTQTSEVATSVDRAKTPEDQSSALTEAAVEIDYRLELGMRELGRRLPEINTIVKQADKMRLDVLGELYQKRFGLDAEAARSFAYIEYAAFSGTILLDPDMPRDRQIELAKLYDRTITCALRKNRSL